MTLNELRAKRDESAKKLRTILETAKAENRDLTDEEDRAWKAEKLEADKIARAIEREEDVEKLEADAKRSTMRGAPPVEDPDPNAGRAPAVRTREDRPYSLVRLLRAQISRDWRDAKVEQRRADELSEYFGGDRQHDERACFIPYAALLPMKRQLEIERRDVNAAGAPSLIGTNLIPDEFIELLRNEAMVVRAGARVLPNLVGNIDLGRQNAAAVGGWIATEGTAAVEGQLTTDKITLTPRTFGLFTEITRKMLKQSTPGVEDLVREDLRQVVAIGVDAATINGTGAAGQPTGILATSGVGTVTHGLGVATWANMVEYETDLGTANALRGRLAFMMRSSVTQILKTTPKITGAGATGFLMENDRSVNGYPSFVTEQMPAATILFGNFAEVLIGMWGALDLFADPYTLGNSGGVVVRGFQDVDVGVRHAASFSKSTGL